MALFPVETSDFCLLNCDKIAIARTIE